MIGDSSPDSKTNAFERRFKRERRARKEAEKLLEEKSLELYQTNLNLEKTVEARTKELEAERNRAIMLSQAKSRFVATMSHEIRTPINGVMGALNLLDEELLPDESRKLLKIAQHSSEVLLHVINDILDYSKIEANQMQMESIPFNLKEKVESVIAHFKVVTEQKSLKLELNWDDQLSNWVMGDSHRLIQVLNNYLSNAIKFTEKGRVKLNVFFNETDHVIRFEVHDSGIGISEEGMSKLFQDFSQVDASTTRQFGGTGLGLVICKKIIELMSGRVGVTSEEGQGSCFWAEIPYQPSKAQKTQENEISVFDQQQDRHQKILLVDDNQVNRKIAEKILERMGYDITLAEDGPQAIDLVNNREFDMVFMDCQMPIMDGFEATGHLRALGFKKPIVALTANTSEEDRQMALNSGMDDFVSKPFKPAEIQQVIQHWASTTIVE